MLPDLFAQIEEQLDQAQVNRIMTEGRARAQLTTRESLAAIGKFLALPAGVALRTAASVAIGNNAFSARIADVFVDWIGQPFNEKMAQVNAAVDDASQQFSAARRARNAVLKEFSERMIVLERQLPASHFTDGSLP